ncbi:MAG: hypothetical protein H6898_16770 [Rhodobacter sp.]|nr:hypothetical protein [Paracoccaceae bacterium]MCC0078211.1 hypothetical protein [Rhodobacter sp.]
MKHVWLRMAMGAMAWGVAAVLGAGDAQAQPVQIAQVAGGDRHTCAIDTAGQVWCWGYNNYGQIGDGTTTDRLTPVLVDGVTGAVALALGGTHSCAIDGEGQTWCWGDGGFGQLGNGPGLEQSLTPIVVPGMTRTVSISAGYRHVCGLQARGQLYCWGFGYAGQIGVGTTEDAMSPRRVRSLRRRSAEVALGWVHTCARQRNGRVNCWGAGSSGQLGIGSTTNQLVPVQVGGLRNVATLALGALHSCAVLERGRVRCWGRNDSGQLGDGTTTDRLNRVRVRGLSRVAQVALGDSSSCALRNNGRVRCWGNNAAGQLGDGTTTQRLAPTEISTLSNVTQIAVGGAFGCAVSDGGRLQCWGRNGDGQLGDGTTSNRLTPVDVVFPE